MPDAEAFRKQMIQVLERVADGDYHQVSSLFSVRLFSLLWSLLSSLSVSSLSVSSLSQHTDFMSRPLDVGPRLHFRLLTLCPAAY